MKQFFGVILAIAFILIGGSVGPWFPWLNLAGGMGLIIIGIEVNNKYNKGELK